MDGQEEKHDGDEAKSIAEEEGVHRGEEGCDVGDDGGEVGINGFPEEILNGERFLLKAIPSLLSYSLTIDSIC